MTTPACLRLAVVIGSTRTDRFGPTPARWIAEHASARTDFEVDVVDLADTRLPYVMNGDDDKTLPAEVAALSPRLAAADAFVVVTPVYNRGYPAALKNAIDWFFDEWCAKPVGYVSYGGMGGGLFAVEQLRQVFNEVHAVSIRNAISFANFWDTWDENGRPIDTTATDGAAKSFLDQLAWWGHALRDARAARPYTA
ncbi:NADPH-dependent FMN reductase [Nocardia sp. CC227C]|uniref:NADPH-dependent FMN reductase n=1 Tax=Nocardia sp. CC227C TaxID=3044562 RepID=UPI00278C6DAE|nr:NAD(P)H-dependent oxidoreductase [Nocardia sp. CC227C]